MSEIKKINPKDFARNEKDTGSPEYQIALLTGRIASLTNHLRSSKKDFQATRGLIAIVNNRKSLLKYLHRTNKSKFLEVVKKLNIRINI